MARSLFGHVQLLKQITIVTYNSRVVILANFLSHHYSGVIFHDRKMLDKHGWRSLAEVLLESKYCDVSSKAIITQMADAHQIGLFVIDSVTRLGDFSLGQQIFLPKYPKYFLTRAPTIKVIVHGALGKLHSP